ncbi:putative transposase YdaD [Desulfitispora alkaliphila]|uniref:Rpn family recombination-promoting nuclease/putative transposase n=1 Tax=Desulfitispora alkaliphila TaxID=622674 RepID=UPI003D1C4E67
MSIIKQPHDKFFKETFRDLETTKDFMRNYLPAEVLEITDLDRITPEKDSFIEKELEETFSDLLFKTQLNGREGYVYFLFEHKSYLSHRTGLQLLKYMTKIWERKLGKGSKEKLPLIIPLVVYHGSQKWNIDTSIWQMIAGVEELPSGIKKYIPNYQYLIYDLSPYGDEEIKGGVKHNALQALDRIEHQESGIDYFETLVRYIMNARSELKFSDVQEISKNISLERSEEIMTVAEELMKKGKLERDKEIILSALKKGYSVDDIAELTGVEKKVIFELKEKGIN